MNLIEQLGGYENLKIALAELREKKKDLIQCGSVFLVENEVLELLLEYRRQHNIFEVGDKVVLASSRFGSYNDGVYTVININKTHALYELCVGWIGFSHYLKHATDKEIAAGRRL